MPVMSAVERAFCRSALWRGFARRTVLPWSLAGRPLAGDVLEIGAGGGAMAEGIARTHPEVQLTATDLDTKMVNDLDTRLSPFPNARARLADVVHLPFEAASFDFVLSNLMLHHVVIWPEALAEVARVLRPGGHFVGYDLLDTRIARWIHQTDRSPFRLIGRDELADGLAQAGFDEISVWPGFGNNVMRFQAIKPNRTQH